MNNKNRQSGKTREVWDRLQETEGFGVLLPAVFTISTLGAASRSYRRRQVLCIYSSARKHKGEGCQHFGA
ncbi:hypothetical protein ILYODFUR_034584 [Ilyodon furcidens]|uniref:Uncharacterized protein n=1 Tax=Ilyodon furcidens TaxID=33524 RepID=A0ABV0UB91_9TELE